MLETKSVKRLERLRESLNIRGKIVFQPTAAPESRYCLGQGQTHIMTGLPIGRIPLGHNAQAARLALKELAK